MNETNQANLARRNRIEILLWIDGIKGKRLTYERLIAPVEVSA